MYLFLIEPLTTLPVTDPDRTIKLSSSGGQIWEIDPADGTRTTSGDTTVFDHLFSDRAYRLLPQPSSDG